ncbi:hypothetical protein ACLK11_12860 [Escherichia coli]
MQALLGVEQTIRMENFFLPGTLPMGVTIPDENGHTLISLTGPESKIKGDPRLDAGTLLVWLYGRVPGAGAEEKSATLIAKHRVFGADSHKVLERIRMLILNAILLNVLAGAALLTLARMYERRIFIPAESDALRLKNMSSSIADCRLRASGYLHFAYR